MPLSFRTALPPSPSSSLLSFPEKPETKRKVYSPLSPPFLWPKGKYECVWTLPYLQCGLTCVIFPAEVTKTKFCPKGVFCLSHTPPSVSQGRKRVKIRNYMGRHFKSSPVSREKNPFRQEKNRRKSGVFPFPLSVKITVSGFCGREEREKTTSPLFCGMRYVGTRIPPAENERSQLLLLSWIEREGEKKDFFPFSCFALKKRKGTNELSHYLFYREGYSENCTWSIHPFQSLVLWLAMQLFKVGDKRKTCLSSLLPPSNSRSFCWPNKIYWKGKTVGNQRFPYRNQTEKKLGLDH